MPPEVAALLGVELGRALTHAHGAGVIHRDLKPENVLIETGDAVKVQLTDFGIAKILDAQGVTSTGQVLGSPAHMAPEQIEGGEVDGRADVFGLGVLLYECMVGHLPFEGKNPAQVLRRVLEGAYAPADRERPSVGARWAKILARALAKEAADRFPTMEALTKALVAELESLGFADAPAELAAFFADPEAYRAAHQEKLVPTLTRRGEQARRARDTHAAAADINRALAYAPKDPTLLRLIGKLQRGRATRRALVVVVAVSAFAALVAFVMSRSWFERSDKPPVVAKVIDQPGPTAVTLPPPTPMPSTSASIVTPVQASSKPSTERPKPHIESPTPVAGPREVSFIVKPQGAKVSIDDGAPEQLPFKATRRLSVGPHTFRASVPDSKCCEPLERTEEIKPEDGSGTPQTVSLSLGFRDAEISAPGAPAGAQLRCPGVSGPASQKYSVRMNQLDGEISCDLEAPGVATRRRSVPLRAGEHADVPWSGE
jgi:serine/threonine-protein kinase